MKNENYNNPEKERFLPAREKMRMTFKYVKKNSLPAITFKGVTLINYGEVFAMVGLPGQGKSTICEIIVCAYLGRESCGFSLNSNKKKALIVDTERPPDDVADSYRSISRRLGRPDLDSEGEIAGLVHLAVSEFGKIADLKAILERELSANEYDLVVLDGILDFSESMNDDKDATDVVKWVRSLAVKHNLALIVTIHPNKGTETIAGHLGSFLHRWCRAILFIRSVRGDKSIKEITGEPEMAKLSHGDVGALEPVYLTWDPEQELLAECEYSPKEQRGQEDKLKLAFNYILSSEKKLRRNELLSALLIGKSVNSSSTGIKWISKATKLEIIKKSNNHYSLNEILGPVPAH